MYIWSKMSVIDAIELVQKRDPRKYSWGYYPIDKSEQTGARGFQWFESPRELLDFIIEKESIASNLTGDGLYEEGYRKLTFELKRAIGCDTTLTTQLLMKINSTETWIEFVWWGTFANLYTGNDGFSRDIINRFSEHLVSDKIKGRIPPECLPEFINFIRDFGLCKK